MSRSKRPVSPKKRRYRRIRSVMLFILILLIAVLGGILVWQKKEEAGAKKAQKAKASAQADVGKSEDQEAQTSGGDDSPDSTDDNQANSGDSLDSTDDNQADSGDSPDGQQESDAAEDNINKEVQLAKNTATEEKHKTNGLAICMYHYVYDKDNPPKDKLNSNFIEVHALEEELKYLTENNYYYPTWEEVKAYVEGDLLLPEKSVVLTFDDGAYSFLNLGVPLFEKYQIPVTSFLIGNIDGKKKVKKYASEYMTFQSHSYNMHRGGGNIGHGGIFPVMDHDEAVADLQKSIKIGGNGDAFAYPYGDYNDSCVQAVKDAGFNCAVTTEYGRAKPGDNPLLLPRVRMSMGQSLASFKKLVE
ncbi:MAG: polysaccharide deacetylase family protein [Dorea sp.]|nr:polysaccharide deacetylase family protein [Dorea sp.]